MTFPQKLLASEDFNTKREKRQALKKIKKKYGHQKGRKNAQKQTDEGTEQVEESRKGLQAAAAGHKERQG